MLDLLTVLDLDPSKTYDGTSVRRLPYRRLVVVTDQDSDGSHIFGLLLALFERFFPSLLSVRPHFVYRFVTPVIRARVAGVSSRVDFFSTSAFRAWEEIGNRATSIDYYKGLGTSTNAEAVEYFGRLREHTVAIEHTGTSSSDALAVFFAKDRIDDRRGLLRRVNPSTFVDYSGDSVSIETFCSDELVHFSRLSIDRAIPHMVDGLKPSTRKIMHHALKHPRKIKVEQLAGEVARETSYHHGAQSLEGAIVGMAQSFCGANNLNMLESLGQFGTRHGEKAAAARYIFTALSPAARLLFRAEDEPVLEHLVDDGQRVEPRHFCPVVPLVLINGADGIGTGWSTSVPSFRPLDIVAACRSVASGGGVPSLVPWVRGFGGKVTHEDGHVTFEGCHSVSDGDGASVHVRVSELPPHSKTNDIKAAYHAMNGVVDVLSKSTMDSVDLEIIFESEQHLPVDLPKKLKLVDRQSTTNMHLIDVDGTLTRYESAEEILASFSLVRLEWYAARISAQMRMAREKAERLYRRAMLIDRVAGGDVTLFGRSRRDLVRDLGAEDAATLSGMSVDEFTDEKIAQRAEEHVAVNVEIMRLMSTTPESAWLTDLDALEAFLLDDEKKKRVNKA